MAEELEAFVSIALWTLNLLWALVLVSEPCGAHVLRCPAPPLRPEPPPPHLHPLPARAAHSATTCGRSCACATDICDSARMVFEAYAATCVALGMALGVHPLTIWCTRFFDRLGGAVPGSSRCCPMTDPRRLLALKHGLATETGAGQTMLLVAQGAAGHTQPKAVQHSPN